MLGFDGVEVEDAFECEVDGVGSVESGLGLKDRADTYGRMRDESGKTIRRARIVKGIRVIVMLAYLMF